METLVSRNGLEESWQRMLEKKEVRLGLRYNARNS